MAIEPLRPEQIASNMKEYLPEEVIQVFNDLIVEHWDSQQATIQQKDALDCICNALTVTSDHVIKKHWLDVETVYKEVGWEVEYHKPAYNDVAFEPYYIFKKKGGLAFL